MLLRTWQGLLSTAEGKPSCFLRHRTSQHVRMPPTQIPTGGIPHPVTTNRLVRAPYVVCRASQNDDDSNRASSDGSIQGSSPTKEVLWANPQTRILTISGVVAGFFLLGFAIKKGMG
eukprot:83316-Pelagomonas_calceolata.AAC.9